MSDETTRDESPSLGKLAGALAKAQGSIRNAAKETMNNNPHVNKKYADLGSVWDACRAALAENELAVTQRVTTDGEEVTLTTMLLHSSGEFLRDRLVVRVSPIGSQPWIQALGISITYARRYALSALVGVAPAGDDTDGEGSQAAAPSSKRRRDEGQAPAGPTTFPNFGKSKGAPIAGAPLAELELYAVRMRESVENPEKARFKAHNRAMLEALEAEIDKQTNITAKPPTERIAAEVDAFTWAKDNIPKAASGDGVDKILNRAGPKVTTDQFAELTGLGRARKVALLNLNAGNPIAEDGPGPGRETEDDAPEPF